MAGEIRQAETAIKSGDTKTAFEILREVLASNPDSEKAWWIMSGLVQRPQRATCLEQVLRINPKNKFAQDALDDLLASPPIPETKPLREIPQPPVQQTQPPPPAPKKKTEPADKGLQTWLHARGSKYFLTILGPKHITRALTDSASLSKVRDELKKGKIPDKLLLETQSISLKSISSIKQVQSGLQVLYQDGVDELTLRLNMADQAASNKVLTLLQDRLGPAYMLNSQPVRTGLNLGLSALLSLGAAGLTAYMFWMAQEVVSGRAAESGSVSSGILISLVNLLGPSGVVLVGAFVLLAALAISAWILLKPPTVTTLSKRYSP